MAERDDIFNEFFISFYSMYVEYMRVFFPFSISLTCSAIAPHEHSLEFVSTISPNVCKKEHLYDFTTCDSMSWIQFWTSRNEHWPRKASIATTQFTRDNSKIFHHHSHAINRGMLKVSVNHDICGANEPVSLLPLSSFELTPILLQISYAWDMR